MLDDATALERSAAKTRGTVNQSDITITLSRTVAVAVKCVSMYRGQWQSALLLI